MEPNGIVVGYRQLKPELTWDQHREIYMGLELVAHGDDVPHGMFLKMEMDYPVDLTVVLLSEGLFNRGGL